MFISYSFSPFLFDIECHFLFRVVNEPLESISLDLGFGGDTMAEGTSYLPTSLFVEYYVDLI